jgi:hypothetical protein
VPVDALVIENGTVIAGTGAAPIFDGIVAIQGDRIRAAGMALTIPSKKAYRCVKCSCF